MARTLVLINRSGGAASQDPKIGETVAKALQDAGLEADVELSLSGVILTLRDGAITAVGAGTWSAVGTLTGHGVELARRATGARPLPGAVDLGAGVVAEAVPAVSAA